MARKPRLHVPGGLYHVILRGNGRQDIFFDPEDRYHLYLLLQEGVTRYAHRIHGFCLMNNHVHLAIQVGEVPLSKIMQNLAFRYTRWVNRRQQRAGHLFQGRYQAILVDAESYLLELVRYIHLNPVRAKMVKKPEDYPWSSHRAYLGAETPPWLHTQWVLAQFGERLGTARRRYARFVAEGIGGKHREKFYGGGDDSRILAEDKFIEKVLGTRAVAPKKVSLDRIVKVVSRGYAIKEAQLRAPGRGRQASQARSLIAWLAMQTGAATLEQVAARFGRDATTLSRLAGRLETRRRASQPFAAQVSRYSNAIMQA